jgi:uncharacterized membrane protein YeiH
MIYWLGLAAVALMAAAGVLEAGRKRFDVFGMVIVALAAALGGGTVRDVLLERPVFGWGTRPTSSWPWWPPWPPSSSPGS